MYYITDEGPYIVVADSMCDELEWYRQRCPTRDRNYDVVTPDWLFKCYEVQELLPVEKCDALIASYETKLRWQYLRTGNKRYLEARYDSD